VQLNTFALIHAALSKRGYDVRVETRVSIARGFAMLRFCIALSATLLLSACATSAIVTGTPRPPIDPSQVRLYYGTPPAEYEEIALLDTSSGSFTYGEQNKVNSVLANLREQAAKVGANGVLFQGTADGYGGSGVSVGAGGGNYGGSGFSSGGIGVSISPRQKFAKGIAIYVANPPPLQQVPEPAMVPPAEPAPAAEPKPVN